MRYSLLPFLALVCLYGDYRNVLLAQWYSGAAAGVAKAFRFLDKVYSAAHGRELLSVPGEGGFIGRRYVRHRARVLRDIDGFFPVSEFTAGLLKELGVPEQKLYVVHNGTDPEQFKLDIAAKEQRAAWRSEHRIPNGPLILTAARLIPRKGVDTVLRALNLVVKERPEVQYAVVGNGPERKKLENLSRRLGIEDRVHFLGQLDHGDLVLAYHECFAFVMPARYLHPSVEGFGLVFREANACGKPVVGARTGGVADAIQHERTGLLVEPDDPQELCAALLRLLSDSEYAERLGRQGRQLVECSGTWKVAAEKILDIMNERAVQATM